MEKFKPPLDVDKTLAETVSAVYDLVNSQFAHPTNQQLAEMRTASEKIDKGYHTLRSILSPAQILGMVAREIISRKETPQPHHDIITSEYGGEG